MGTPAISVAMSVYNGERFLAEAIESVLGQTFGDLEFLIVDDGSTDSSRAMIEAYAAKDARIRPIVRENRGLIASLNQMLDEAQAPLVARMDADDVCLPERLEKQVEFLDAHPDYGVLGCWTVDIDENGGDWTSGDWTPHPLTHEEFVEHIDQRAPLLCHPAVVFRRDLVRAVGGYHAAYTHCEDLDLWLRLASITKIGNIPVKLLRYRHYAGQVSSRHAVEQAHGAAIARLAYDERKAGRPDPTEHLAQLPSIDSLDALFGRNGVSHEAAAMTARRLLYSRDALQSDAFDLVVQLARAGADQPDLWRTVARLVRFGEPKRALRLAATLARAA
jgi:glycosyltransferase involved in cell wall biosynthesis